MPHSCFSFSSFSFLLHLLLFFMARIIETSSIALTLFVVIIISLPQLSIFLPSLTFCLLDSSSTYLFSPWFQAHLPFTWYPTCLIHFVYLHITTYLFLFFFKGLEYSFPLYASGMSRAITCVISVHLPHVSVELAQC